MRATLILLICGAAAWTQTPPLTHEQKVANARRLISSTVYASEFGRPVGPEPYAGMTDAQLQQEVARHKSGYEELARQEHATRKEFDTYRQKLVDEGKTTHGMIESYTDPTGRLQQVRTNWEKSSKGLCDNNLTQWNLETELKIRTDPDFFIAVEARLQADLKDDTAQVLRELAERVKAGDREAMKILGIDPPPRTRPVESKTPTKIAIRLPAVKTEFTYADLYGPEMDPRIIESIEKQGIERLPPELKRDVPADVQRLFYYGGYEHLPVEVKQRLRAAVDDLRQSGQMQGRSLEQEFGRVFTQAQTFRPPMWMRVTVPSQAKHAMLENIGFLLMAATQGLVDSRYDRERRDKWRAAYREVAAKIPAGKLETVVFFEDMERQQLDMITWFECRSVHGYRGTMEVHGCPANPAEPLPDLRHGGVPGYLHFSQVTKVQVLGTGAGRATPTVQEAYIAGCEMGKAALAGRLTNNLMRTTYSEYNKDPAMQAAFKRGYNAGAQGGVSCGR